ncbi:hypothetical protein BD779DRAFT_1802677 [Infundibulicybe gibba]|nr:hypothetical protein BD779DRAFT_1802677 [Infundibulicybe gibba]
MAFTQLDGLALGSVLECTLYGVYVALFILYLVLQRRSNRFGGPLTLAQMLLFGLCTVVFFLDIPRDYFWARSMLSMSVNWNMILSELILGNTVLFTMIDSLAHAILFYRCWIIWDKQWTVMAIPGFLLLAPFVIGFTTIGLSSSSTNIWDLKQLARIWAAKHSISLIVNALTTSLIVAKIFLISREVGPVLGSNSHRSLRVVNAMLIESGLLMFAYQLIFVVLYSIQHPATAIVGAPILQIYGITPTLLGVRVAMGSTYDKTTVETRSLRFAHSAGGAATWATGPSTMNVAGVQSQNTNIELGDASNSEGVGNAV